MKRISLIIAAVLCLLSYSVSAKQTTQSHTSYIYCLVQFQSTDIVKGRKVKMYVDYGQTNFNIFGLDKVLNADGEEKTFNSEIAGLNWLGMQGWELTPYPSINEGDPSSKFYMRMDVTGLSYEEINEKLSIFSNKRFKMDHADTVRIQTESGLFDTIVR